MEIKVRAWDKENKKMLNPDAIWLKHQEISIEGCFYKDVILMLSTGLTDKNGKEIYEADIVKYLKALGIVEFRTDFGCWDVTPLPPSNCYFCMWEENWSKIEVIGNIWENPNLLKGGKNED